MNGKILPPAKTMTLTYFLTNMKKIQISDQPSKAFAVLAQSQENALQLGFPKKNGESGEGYTWKMVKSPESLTDIEQRRGGQRHGKI